jgi:hypothetical protein
VRGTVQVETRTVFIVLLSELSEGREPWDLMNMTCVWCVDDTATADAVHVKTLAPPTQ